MRGRWALFGFVIGLAASAWLVAAWPASARPVRIGHYTEIPYGISEAHPYPTGDGDARRNGRARASAPDATPTMRWEARLRAGRPSTPAVDEEGWLYVASAAGVTAIDPEGETRWNVRLGFVGGTPSLTPTGDLAVGTTAGAVVFVSKRGELMARTPVGGAVRGSPLVLADGSVVVGAFDQALHRFDAEGRRLFRAPLPFQVMGAPAWTEDGHAAVASGDRLVVTTVRGEIRTEEALGASIVSGPAIADDGTVWALTQDAALHQLSPRFASRSRTELGAPVTAASNLGVGRDGAVRVPTRESLVCVGPTGTPRWTLDTEGGFQGGVTLDRDDVALAVNERGTLIAVDRNGQVRWRAETGIRTDMAPALGPDGTIYIANNRGTIQAWR